MQIKSITYSHSKEYTNPYGLKQWVKYGIEVELTDTDDPEKAKELAQNLVTQWHNQHNNDEMKGTVVRPVEEEPKLDKRIATIIADLNQCTEISRKNDLGVEIGLIAYEEVAKSNPEIKAAFDLKMLQLTK